MQRTTFKLNKLSTILLSIFILLISASNAFATPISPGTTLDPSCTPTTADCYVTPMNIGGTINSATLGSLLFAGTGGILAQDNSNLFWDDTNNRLGVGTTTPSSALEIKGVTTEASLGSEKATNGTFDTDGTGWTATTWSAGSAKMNYTGSAGPIASDAISFGGGNGYSTGNVLTIVNGANDATLTVTDSGWGNIWSVSLSNPGTANTVADAVAVTGGGGSGFTLNILRLADSANTLSQDVSVTAGDTYQVTYTVTRSAGELNVTLGGVSGNRVKASGTYVQTITASTTGNLIFTPTYDFTGSIDSISVKKVNTTSSLSSIVNSDGSAGVEIRAGGALLYNTFVGYNAGLSNTTGTYNSAFGYQGLFANTTGYYNSALGYKSLFNNTTGYSNTAMGYLSMNANTVGYRNVAVGNNTLEYNTTGTLNTAVGPDALRYNTTGYQNTALGEVSLRQNTTGYQNTALGIAMVNNTTGNENVAIGWLTMQANISGSKNVAVGRTALAYNYSGNNNTALGYGAGFSAWGAQGSYSNNLFIGYQAGNNLTTGADNNIVIGYDLDLPTASGDNQLTIGNILYGTTIDGTGTTVSTGKIGIGDATPDYRFDIDADVASYASGIFNDGNATTRSGLYIQAGLDDHTAAGPSTLIGFADGDGTAVGSITFGSSATAYNTTSDQRLKNLVNEETSAVSLQTLRDIKIHDFTWKDDVNNTLYTGVFAQELYNVYPHAVTKPVDENIDNWMVDYSKLVPVTIAGIKGLDTKITDIENLNPESTFVTKLKEWLASATNGIDSLFAKKIKTNELCVGEVCVTESQFLQILNNSNANQNTNSTEGSQSTEEVVPVVEDTPDPTPTEENVTPEEPVVEPETVPVVEEEQAVQVDVPNGLIIE